MFKTLNKQNRIIVERVTHNPVYLSGTSDGINVDIRLFGGSSSQHELYNINEVFQLNKMSLSTITLPSDILTNINSNTFNLYKLENENYYEAKVKFTLYDFTRGSEPYNFLPIYNKLNNYWLKNPCYSHEIDATAASSFFNVINIPNVLIGNNIKSGSFAFRDYDSDGARYFIDDGYGRVFHYGTNHNDEQVGFAFYDLGMILSTASWMNNASYKFQSTGELEFTGSYYTYTNLLTLKVPANELALTSNPTYASESAEIPDANEPITKESFVYATTINLYDKEYNLVAQAKMANPILKNNDKDIVFKLRLDT